MKGRDNDSNDNEDERVDNSNNNRWDVEIEEFI